VKDCGTALSWD